MPVLFIIGIASSMIKGGGTTEDLSKIMGKRIVLREIVKTTPSPRSNRKINRGRIEGNEHIRRRGFVIVLVVVANKTHKIYA